ncbi:hypothetical protein HMPREF3293_01355 [Christensenella minuta]|jgi:DNA-directed RNA polymerase subunit M/transcription elongation factor TFIIS|uniref:Uncharacterized protein n=2 Tax=Christensenella minuta TaxID=626937 RepID=A0A136Q5E4_9FIRM|nr:hypothetical protein HMPREF3293_01355 [Christensenella minuta]
MAANCDIISLCGGNIMECKKCGTVMYARISKQASNATQVYICPKCHAIVYVWPDGEVKEEKSGRA